MRSQFERLSESALLLANDVCNRFEAAWQQDGRPNLAEFLEESGDLDREVLLQLLLPLELDYRRLAGESPTEAEYHQAFPDDKETIRRVFAADGQEPSRSQAPAATMDQPISERPGTVIGRYKLMERIGEGGMGLVFVAMQQEPIRRKVALKLIKPGMDTNEVIARFEAERQALALMDHPHIARVLDGGATESGRPYFVMELVRGVPITEYCDKNNLTARSRLELFTVVCQAIQHAHQKGIIHRDVKPSNVMVTLHDGVPVVKVIDFGVAKAINQQLTERTIYTRFAHMVGTPLYMSPEQAELTGLDIDTRSDVYSLGVLLYELLTGTTPFDKDRIRRAAYDEICRIIREEDPPKPSTRISTLGETASAVSAHRKTDPKRLGQLMRGELDWIVMKALDKDRGRRYATAASFAEDIQHYLNDESVVACPPSAAYRFRKFASRNRSLIATATIIAAVLVAATVVSSCLAIWALHAQKVATRNGDKARESAAAERRARQGEILARQREEAQRKLAETSAKKARMEAVRSAQVAELLAQMVEGVAPAVALGRDTTLLREMVETTSEQLERGLADHPQVEADLRMTLGRVYFDLGDYARAESMYRRALDLRAGSLNEEDPRVAASLNALGDTLGQQGRFAEAEQLQRRALAARQEAFGETHLDVAQSWRSMSRTLSLQHKYPDAEVLARKAHGVLARLQLEDDRMASSLAQLASLIQQQGRYAEAEQLFLQVVGLRTKIHSGAHYSVAIALDDLSGNLRLQHKLKEAEAAQRRAVQVLAEMLIGAPLTRLRYLVDHAVTLLDLGNYQKAQQTFQQYVALAKTLYGREDRTIAVALRRYAQRLVNYGYYGEAAVACRRALEIHAESHGAENRGEMLLTLDCLAAALRHQEKPSESAEILRQALAIGGRGSQEASRTRQQLASALFQAAEERLNAGEPIKAEAGFREALSLMQAASPRHWKIDQIKCMLGISLLRQEKHSSGESLLLEGCEGLTKRRIHAPAREAIEQLTAFYEQSHRLEDRDLWKQRLNSVRSTLRPLKAVYRDELRGVTSVKESADGNHLYAAAWHANAVAAFARDPSSGMISHVQTPENDGDLTGAVSVSLNDSSTLCAVACMQNTAVVLFRRNSTSGLLEKMSVYGNDGNLRFPVESAFSPDSRFLFVIDSRAVHPQSKRQTGALVTLRIDRHETLRWVATNYGVNGCFRDARGITVHPDQTWIYVTTALFAQWLVTSPSCWFKGVPANRSRPKSS